MFHSVFNAVDISASGLTAERYRMEVIANNIANAYATRTPEGGAYRRQQVMFASKLDQQLAAMSQGPSLLRGVRVLGTSLDPSDMPQVHNPGHPDADANGMVTMPNVKIPYEMVDLISASRAYEANLRSIRSYQRMAQQTLTLLRGNI